MRIVVDAADNILYKSYYIYALEQLFPGKVKHSVKPFSDLSDRARSTWSMRFVIDGTKYVISCNDSYAVDKELYDWCDVYGCVNANRALTPVEFRGKLISLCPSFGVRCWSPAETAFHAVAGTLSLALSGSLACSGFKKYAGKYWHLLKDRVGYGDYVAPTEVSDDYVFFCSTLWYNNEYNHNDEGVNRTRADFIRACKSVLGLRFEGGLVSQGPERSSEDLFRDCLSRPYPMEEWMKKTRESVCVFNTPAFWNCHGWKLGEYLSMGKAIVSTPLSNDLPEPLVHGVNVHFVENEPGAMKEAVEKISLEKDYRMKIERGTRDYWEAYGSPEASLKLLGIEL